MGSYKVTGPLSVVFALSTLLLVGCASSATTPGGPVGSKASPREIKVLTEEMKFGPDRIQVKPGETVRFVVVNQGKLPHELVLGDEKAQMEHEGGMAAGKEMHMSDEPGQVKVDPGKTKTLVYTFPEKPGTLMYGCHEPGHWAAGMKGTITIG